MWASSTCIDHKQQKFRFAQHQEDAINLVSNRKTYMEIPVAIVQDETIPVRSTCHLTIQCKWTPAPPDVAVYFDPEQSEGNGALLIFPHAITQVDSGQVCVAVHNCSMQPAKTYANTVVGKITPIHFNPQIAVLVDPYNRDNEYGPIGLAEDQFDEIAQRGHKLSEATGTPTDWTEALSWNSILTTAQRTALLLSFTNVFLTWTDRYWTYHATKA